MIYAGVELGGTKCIALLASGPGEVLGREVIPTTSPDETLGRIESTLLRWKQTHDFGALGIASFGPIDLDPRSATYGHMLVTTKPGWNDVNVALRLQQSTDVPTFLDTDVNGAAIAEMKWGAGRGFADFAYVTVGTGVGVGMIVNGKPTRGFAHCEFGHIRVARLPDDDWPGSCPYHADCVEGIASGSALRARFGEEIGTLKANHPVWESVAWTLGQLCHAIVCASAPRRIAFGGGVIDQQPHLLERIEAKLIESLNGFILLPPNGPYVCAPELGKDAGPLGSIALAMTPGSRPR